MPAGHGVHEEPAFAYVPFAQEVQFAPVEAVMKPAAHGVQPRAVTLPGCTTTPDKPAAQMVQEETDALL